MKETRKQRFQGEHWFENTLIMPVKHKTFQHMVLEGNYLSKIFIYLYRIGLLKYIAFYRTGPVYAITHIATIVDIKRSGTK